MSQPTHPSISAPSRLPFLALGLFVIGMAVLGATAGRALRHWHLSTLPPIPDTPPALIAPPPPPPLPPRFPLARQAEAWQRLPREASVAQQSPPLPVWALMLVETMPRTTAAMLELDYLHRAANPLGALHAAKLRWLVAEAIGCRYGMRYAEADLLRAGLAPQELATVGNSTDDAERAVAVFARKMTRAAETITDEEVADLLQRFGPAPVVALVHTLAYANFQNRIWLALGGDVEADGPLPPLELKLDPQQRQKVTTPPRPTWNDNVKQPLAEPPQRPDWRALTLDDLDANLEQQKSRSPRIPLLDAGQLAHLPPDERGPAQRILWSNISMGHQPTLTRAWFDCMNTAQDEAKLPRLFRSSVFWVITRGSECFY